MLSFRCGKVCRFYFIHRLASFRAKQQEEQHFSLMQELLGTSWNTVFLATVVPLKTTIAVS